MDIPIITDEQRVRFGTEFHTLSGHRAFQTYDRREIWLLARAYSEMQTENLLGTVGSSAYPCPVCRANTVNVAAPPDVDLQCPECGWVPVEVVEAA